MLFQPRNQNTGRKLHKQVRWYRFITHVIVAAVSADSIRDLWRGSIYMNLSAAGASIFWDNCVNTIAADILSQPLVSNGEH